VVEGVETDAQIEFLMQHDCPVFQGYFYSKPLPSDQFVAFYKGRQSMQC
jgi:sensor c-di-GMP phosphodiesterase-like protein